LEAVAIYLLLVFQPEFILAFKCIFRDGARAAQTAAAFLLSNCNGVAHTARPGETWVEFYLTPSSLTDTWASRLW